MSEPIETWPVACAECGAEVEEARRIYVVPTCYACLPPPIAPPASERARAEGIAAGLRMAAEHARGCEEEADLRCAGARGPQGHYEHGATNMAANVARWCEAQAGEVER